MQPLDIGVVGGSIAGCSAAILLARVCDGWWRSSVTSPDEFTYEA